MKKLIWAVLLFPVLAFGQGQSGTGATGIIIDQGGAVYNVKAYGAVCNGSTDDTAAIQSAITAALATRGTVQLCNGTSIISPPTALQIFTVGSNLHITGCGMGCSILKIKDAAGDYKQVFGATAPSNVTMDNFTVNMNSTNNQPTSLATYYRDLTWWGSAGSNNIFDHIEVLDANDVNIIYSGANNTQVTNSHFTLNTTGTYYHDHSSLYLAGENLKVIGNYFQGGVNAAGSGTAIETHAAKQVIQGNSIDSYEIAANVTGINATYDSVGVTVTGNVVTNGYGGFQLWSNKNGAHQSGYGLDNVTVTGNSLRLTQTAWTTDPFTGNPINGATIGIYWYSGMNLPTRNVVISNNTLEWDLETPGTPPYISCCAGIGFWDSSNTATVMISGMTISDNTIVNMPYYGIRLSASYQDVKISNNHIINPGSSGNPSLSVGVRVGILLGPPTGGTSTNLQVTGNKISDTQATSTIVYGVLLNPIASSVGTEVTGNQLAISDATHTSFQRGCEVLSSLGTPPLVQCSLSVASFSTTMEPSHTVSGGSYINDDILGHQYMLGGGTITGSAGAIRDYSATAQIIVPNAAGAAPTAGGDIRYDTTSKSTVVGAAGGQTGKVWTNVFVATPTNDMICAKGSDTSIYAQTISSAGGHTASTVSLNIPATVWFHVGDSVLVDSAVPAGLNGKWQVTARTATQVTISNNTNADWTSGGTVSLPCTNSTDATGVNNQQFATTVTIPANTWTAGKQARINLQMMAWSSNPQANVVAWGLDNGGVCCIVNHSGTQAMTVSMSGVGFTTGWSFMCRDAFGDCVVQPLPNNAPFSAAVNQGNSTAQPQALGLSAQTYSITLTFSANTAGNAWSLLGLSVEMD